MNRGFIVQAWEKIFYVLSLISILKLIKKLLPKMDAYLLVEIWVVFNVLLSIVGALLTYLTKSYSLGFIFSLYAFYRIFEILVTHIKITLFDSIKKIPLKSVQRSIILLIHNIVEMIFWFLTIYVTALLSYTHNLTADFFVYFLQSVLCLLTFDYQTLLQNVNNNIMFSLASFEVLSGMILFIVVLARLIGMIPAVELDDK